MATKNTSCKENNLLGCYCSKCKVYVDEIHLNGLSLICPYCGQIIWGYIKMAPRKNKNLVDEFDEDIDKDEVEEYDPDDEDRYYKEDY